MFVVVVVVVMYLDILPVPMYLARVIKHCGDRCYSGRAISILVYYAVIDVAVADVICIFVGDRWQSAEVCTEDTNMLPSGGLIIYN